MKSGNNHLPYDSAHSVTVPGAAAAWCDAVEQFGSGKVMCVCAVHYRRTIFSTWYLTDFA